MKPNRKPKATASPQHHIKELVPDPQNFRKHNPRNIGLIVDSLQSVGAARSIVIDEHDNILAGNGTVEAAGEAGITKLKIVEADGNEIVAVRRRGLTDEQKKKLALFDNRSSELATWDADLLKQISDINPKFLQGVGFTDEELKELINSVPVEPQDEQHEGDESVTCPKCGHKF